MTIMERIDKEGFAKTGDFGGQPKTTYWTPDGRKIRAMPDMHEYTRRDKDGKVIDSGVRDANLDKGWLNYKPTSLQLFCPHCDRWHMTKADVDTCGKSKKRVILKAERLAKKEMKLTDDGRVAKLEQRVDGMDSKLDAILAALKKG